MTSYYQKNREKILAKKAERAANLTAEARAAKAAYNKTYSAHNREKLNTQRRARRYGLAVVDVSALAAAGVCAICKTKTTDNVIDHCHTSGVVRDLLCRKCNSGLGMFNDNPEALEAAAAYLRKHHEFIATNEPVLGSNEQKRPECQHGIS